MRFSKRFRHVFQALFVCFFENPRSYRARKRKEVRNFLVGRGVGDKNTYPAAFRHVVSGEDVRFSDQPRRKHGTALDVQYVRHGFVVAEKFAFRNGHNYPEPFVVFGISENCAFGIFFPQKFGADAEKLFYG